MEGTVGVSLPLRLWLTVRKRMRRPINPAFGDRTIRFVWDTAMCVAAGLFETPQWKGRQEVRIGHAVDVTLSVSLRCPRIMSSAVHPPADGASRARQCRSLCSCVLSCGIS